MPQVALQGNVVALAAERKFFHQPQPGGMQMDERHDLQDEQGRLDGQPEQARVGQRNLPAGPGADERLPSVLIVVDRDRQTAVG